jgi:hypothetical protein
MLNEVLCLNSSISISISSFDIVISSSGGISSNGISSINTEDVIPEV